MPLSSGLPPLPTSFRRRELTAVGFRGWRTWGDLRSSALAEVPCARGAYIVYRGSPADPVLVHPSPAGWFKGEDPTVSVRRLNDEWVPGAHVLYIGKADFRRRRKPLEALHERLEEFMRFGAGEAVGHRGGRVVWQLADAWELLVAWHEITWHETPRDYEKRLLRRFLELHDERRPFANLVG